MRFRRRQFLLCSTKLSINPLKTNFKPVFVKVGGKRGILGIQVGFSFSIKSVIPGRMCLPHRIKTLAVQDSNSCGRRHRMSIHPSILWLVHLVNVEVCCPKVRIPLVGGRRQEIS